MDMHRVLSIPMTTQDLIGTRGAAEILGITTRGVSKAVREGRLVPIARLGDRGVNVFDRAEIERLAAEGARDE